MESLWQVSLDDIKRSEMVLAYYLAPVILHEKPAALFAFQEDKIRQIEQVQYEIGLSTYLMGRKEDHCYLLIYQKELVQEVLERREVKQYLKEKGYDWGEITIMLQQFKRRYEAYLAARKELLFPHEIGALLGYPMGDVIAYEQQKGQHALLNGYWKVYQDVEGAKACFGRYDGARKELMNYVRNHPLSSLGKKEAN